MKNMTYEEKVKFYEKIGAAMTLIYKEKYPSVCKITITQQPSVFIRGVEFISQIVLTMYVKDYEIPDFYFVDKSVRDYFNINVDRRETKLVKNCK